MGFIFFLIVIALLLLLANWGKQLAEIRNQDGKTWFILTLLFPISLLILVVAFKEDPEKAKQRDALRANNSSINESETPSMPEATNKEKNIVIGVVIAIVALLLLLQLS